MINSQSPVRVKRAQILEIAAQNGVERLRVFGSVARGTEDEQSDIDFLVELAPDRSLLDLGNFLYEVRSLLRKDCNIASGTVYWLKPLTYENRPRTDTGYARGHPKDRTVRL